VAVVADGVRIGSPCGVCRQAMAEFFAPGTPVFLSLMSGNDFITTSVAELLPLAFTQQDLYE
jgi:cytidine deaminase